MTRLIDAIHEGNLDQVNQYIAEGDSPNELGGYDNQDSPLHAATLSFALGVAYDTTVKMVEALLKAGANVNFQEKLSKRTALHLAARYHLTEIVDLLLKNGADVHLTECLNSTALHEAASLDVGGQVDFSQTIRLLLEAGSNPNAIDEIGRRPISQVRFSGSKGKGLVELMEQYGKEQGEQTKYEKDLTSLLAFARSLRLFKEDEDEDDHTSRPTPNSYRA